MTTMQGVASQTETAVIGGVGEILGPEQVSELSLQAWPAQALKISGSVL
jgi:hypothetical protein